MTPEMISQLRARMSSEPRALHELHRAALAAGSSWSEDQVALLLACLPDVVEQRGAYSTEAQSGADDSLARALLQVAGSNPVPAAALMRRMPQGVLVTPAALCEIARNRPDLELVGPNRIRRKAVREGK